MTWLGGAVPEGDQALELAVAHALLRRASAGDLTRGLRIYRPTGRTVAFGRRDTRLPGFPEAVAAARAAGFTPVVRPTGGRAVAYTGNAVVVDQVLREPNPAAGLDQRFERFGDRLVAAFRSLGVDARLGPVPGEYCPGAHSVNARGTVKLVGTAQRVVRQAWLFSALVMVGDEDLVRPVLDEVYRRLALPFDGASVGSLGSEVAGLRAETVEAALAAAYGDGATPGPPDRTTLALARELVAGHRVGPA